MRFSGVTVSAVFSLFFVARSAFAATTVVSIDFDDGFADQMQAASMLQAHGMAGTFFIIGGYLEKTGYLTSAQLQQLQAAGNEIGGHTVSHPDLTTLATDEAQREICLGRTILLDRGLDVRSFAYPYGLRTPMVEFLAAVCGYNSARAVGFSWDGSLSETLPPLDPYAIQTPASIRATDTVAEIEGRVQAAEMTGGWLHLIFHHVCDNACDPYSITPANFGALLDWLAARQRLGTVVRTVRQVIGGGLRPGVPGPPPTRRTTKNLLLNPSLEHLDAAGAPSCWQRYAWGTNTAGWTTTGSAYDGAFAQEVNVSSFTNGGLRLVPSLDLGHCAPPGIPGHTYRVTASYKSSTNPIWVFMNRTSLGQWVWWTQGAYLPPTSEWTVSSFTTPPLPSGSSALSFGLSLYGVGSLTVDDFELVDLGPTPPVVTLLAPSDASFVRGSTSVLASASSVIGVDHVDFLVDDVTVASSSAPPYSFTWGTTSHAEGVAHVAARAYDSSGIATTATSTVTVSNHAGLLLNPSLETVNASGIPGCWQRVSWGSNQASWTSTSDAHSGARAQQLSVTSFANGGARLMPTLDSSGCAPTGAPGHTYTVTGWYESSVQPILVFYYRNAAGTWVWWVQSAGLPVATRWTQVAFTTPQLPPGATAVSFGLSLYDDGLLTVDDFTLQMN